MTLSLARFAGLAAATVAGVCAVGSWPTWALAGSGGLVSMAIAAGISFVGAIAGYLPSALASKSLADRVQLAMTGVLARMLFTGAAVVLVLLAGLAPSRMPFVVWTAVDYFTLLALETTVLLRGARDMQGNGGPTAA